MPRLIDEEVQVKINPRYPIYIPSKGRANILGTAKTFDQIGVPYSIVVQPQQEAEYRQERLQGKFLILPDGLDGLVPTRNWIWDHAEALGTKRFWTFDDNIRGLYRLNKNLKTPVADGAILRTIEQFTERYTNIIISGCNYFMFAPRKARVPPLTLNTRVYSNMLILTNARNSLGETYRNVGVYNDDTDLCLRVLKDGWCTVLFNAFLIGKMQTMTVGGGMTPLYQGGGRLKMAMELWRAHPDVVKVVQKWGRWQHQVDYRPFKKNQLIPVAPGQRQETPPTMVRQRLVDGEWVEG